MPDGTAYDPYPGQTSTTGGNGTYQGGNTGYNWSGYAEWLAKTKNSTKTCNLIVNYYANGYNGSAAENPPPSSVRSYTGQSVDVRLVVEVASGDTMSNPGYIFVGWATSNNTPTVTYNPGDTISNSWAADYRGNSITNLYAVWTNQNVITYNPDDNSIEKSAIYQIKQSGQSATLKGATFTRTGYTQTGWATTAGGPKVYNLGGTYSSNNPLSLYPVWQANTYTITYVANEGTGTMADQTVTYDSTFTPRACSFIREGYSFSSWNESQDGKGIRWKVQEYTVDRAENITLYAIWKGNEYTVYYDDNYSRYSDEITGDIVTFESEYAQPLKKVEVSFSPIQDLHGYDHPWPAGGGKNLCYADASNLFPRGDGLTIVENAGTYTAYAKVSKNTDYVFSCATTPFRSSLFGFESEPAVGVISHSLSYTTPTTTSRAFNSGSYEWVGLYYGTPENPQTNVMIEAGTTPTTFAPYENICPISGRTGLNVYRTGVNVWDEQWEVGGYSTVNGSKDATTNRIRCKYPIPCKPGTSYYFNHGANAGNIFEYAADGSFIKVNSSPGVFTTTANTHFLTFYMASSYGTTYNHDISINYPSTDTDYHAYQGQTIAVDWTSQAGTVYGGTLDVVTGVLTVDWIYKEYNGTEEWHEASTNTYYYLFGQQPSKSNTDTTQKSNIFVAGGYGYEGYNKFRAQTNGAVVVGNKNEDGTVGRWADATAFKSFLAGLYSAGTPFAVCYELATPLTYQLTPTQVAVLAGTNNVWSDGGPITIVYALDEVPQNMPPSTAIFGDIFYTRRNQLSRFGLTFKGWNTVPDGSGEAWLSSGVWGPISGLRMLSGTSHIMLLCMLSGILMCIHLERCSLMDEMLKIWESSLRNFRHTITLSAHLTISR